LIVASLKRQVKVQTSTLLSSSSARHVLESQSNAQAFLTLPHEANPIGEIALSRSKVQEAHNQQCLYRTCASITSFKVKDPDPGAVDNGKVLGIRIEVMTKARFLRPYYVMLNRPYTDSHHLRVHRHTVPPCIPLPGLAVRHLPAPKPADAETQTRQDLPGFARALRREIVRYHCRISVISDLRKAVGLDGKGDRRDFADIAVANLSAADSQAKQISIEWTDGRTGRIVMDDDGQVLKLVVFGEKGRDREVVRAVLGAGQRIEDVAKKIQGL
jgi:central kinetochore subunit Mal2/MCM21